MKIKVDAIGNGFRLMRTDDGKETVSMSVLDMTWIVSNLENEAFKEAWEAWQDSNEKYLELNVPDNDSYKKNSGTQAKS